MCAPSTVCDSIEKYLIRMSVQYLEYVFLFAHSLRKCALIFLKRCHPNNTVSAISRLLLCKQSNESKIKSMQNTAYTRTLCCLTLKRRTLKCNLEGQKEKTIRTLLTGVSCNSTVFYAAANSVYACFF